MNDVIMIKLEIECNLNNIKNIIGGKKVMLKHFLAVMLLFVLAVGSYSQSIPSGTGRHAALSNSPFILDAHVDMLSNPAWNNYYRNYAFADLTPVTNVEDGGSSDQFNGHAGVTFAIGKKWNLGMIINNRQDAFSLFDVGPYRPNNSPIVPFMGLIGYSASKNFHISLAPYVSMGKSDMTDTSGALNVSNTSRSMGANLGFMYLLKKGWVEGAVRFRMNKFENDSSFTGGSVLADNDGGIELGVGFRGWIYPTKGSKIAVVPLLGFYTYSFTPKITVGSTTTTGPEYSWLSVNGGVGLNWPIMDDIQIAGGVTAVYSTNKSTFTDTNGTIENKVTDLIAPGFNLALETRIADWLTGRMGFSKSIRSGKFETNTQEFNGLFSNSSSETFSMGAGFHFGRFSVDATVSERWFKHGLNFISGQSNELFGVMSASYNFNK